MAGARPAEAAGAEAAEPAALPAGAARIGLDGRILDSSAELEARLGHPPGALVGRELGSLLHAADWARLEALVERLVAGDVPRLARQLHFVHRGGHTVTLLLSCSLARGASGAPRHLVAELQDLSGLRETELELRRLAAIVESSADAIFSVDLEDRLTSWNPGAESLFGWRADEVIGRRSSILVPPDRLAEHRRLREGSGARRVQRVEAGRVRKDGSQVEVLLTMSPIRDSGGEPVGTSIIGRDITRAKAREAELEQALRRLRAMTEIAFTLGGETEVDRVLDVIARRGRALVEARTLLVLLDDGDGLVVAAGAGEQAGELAGARLAASGPAQEVLRSGRPARLGEVPDALVPEHGGTRLAPAAALVVPLAFRERRHGVLAAFDRLVRGPGFGDEDERLLRSYAATAATAVATARSAQQARVRESIEASEQERRRWARELHDETLQSLAALRVSLSWALRSGSSEELAAAAGGAVEQLAGQIDELRSLISELRPPALEELGLASALETLVERHRSAGGPELEADVRLGRAGEPGPDRLDPQLERTVYRLVQEALTNVQKHARATSASVRVSADPGAIHVAVCDHGAGFDPQSPASGFGLIGMLERTTLAGGRLEVRSAPGEGTCVEAAIPVPASPPAAGR